MSNIFILKTAVSVTANIETSLYATIKEHGARAMELLQIGTPVNITVYPNAGWTIPETGEGGYTPTGDWIQISLDLTGKTHEVRTVIEKRLPATIYHEMNHIKRWNTVGFGATFIENLISEGLACAFELEQAEHDVKPFFLASESEIKELFTVVASSNDRIQNSYSYFDWFTVGNTEIPKWLGYKLGYYVISEVLNRDPNLKVLGLMDKSAQELISMSGIDELNNIAEF